METPPVVWAFVAGAVFGFWFAALVVKGVR